MDNQTQQVLIQMERLGEEILTLKQQKIDLDQKRQQNREALRALQNSKSDGNWLFQGSFFIRKSSSDVYSLVQQDQSEINNRITEIEEALKAKTHELIMIEGEAHQVSGFNLKPLTREDWDGIEGSST
eukprot:TRINITY_DN9735_c0_g1_i1.p1 TRINITY_DN9735_c0_g1~~TRINITY_DN9735_c0_g1_i1.p1  ORF type:complete len:140 (-),score=35.61 TRINITY_DN9735_c0_g1_i1:131-514(-)